MEQRLLRAKQLDMEQKQKLEDKEEKSNNLKMKLTAENQEKAGRYAFFTEINDLNIGIRLSMISLICFSIFGSQDFDFDFDFCLRTPIRLESNQSCIEQSENLLWLFIWLLLECCRVRAALLQRQQEAEQRRKAEEMAKLREYVIISFILASD